MKTLVARLLPFVLLMGFLSATPSFAAEDWPAAPTPNWASTSVIQGIRLGQWLPCDPTWKSTTDCIQGLTWTKTDGSKSGEATFVPNPSFDPLTAKQIWEKANDPQGGTLDNYAHFDGIRAGSWRLPDGFENSDGSNEVYVEAHVMESGLQFRVIPNSSGNLPSNSVAKITLKSAKFGELAGWILSNTKNPGVTVTGDIVTISGSPVVTPFAGSADASTCTSNKVTAAGALSMIQISVLMWAGQTVKAGDAIVGTNGVQCFTGVGFDPSSKTLVVGVGNVHFNVDGTPVQGWFDLKIKGARAKEWWGLEPSIAIKSVQVQVLYEDGTSVVATTEAGYEKANDWITLKSQGFHYSSPQLRVTFGKAPLKSTITCVKGKTSKKVTAAKPKCPNGYIKK